MNNYIDGFKINWDSLDENSYVRNIKSLLSIDELRFNNPITFFVGENGSGKSTLLEAIAENYGFNKEGGTKNYNFSTFKESSDLADTLVLYKGYKSGKYGYFFRAETFFNVATKEEEYAKYGPYESKHYHNESHGEGFLDLFIDLTKSQGIFLMDEPEAALSPQRQLSLLSLIYDASKRGSQFIIVTHSPILLGMPNAEILSFDNGEIKKINYEETSSYKIISSFINHKDLMIKELTNDK